MIINAYLSSRIVPDILVTELEFSRQILEKCTNIKFHEKPVQWESSCSMRTDRYVDKTKLIFSDVCMTVHHLPA